MYARYASLTNVKTAVLLNISLEIWIFFLQDSMMNRKFKRIELF